MRAVPRADRLAGVVLVLLVVALFRESLVQGGVFYERDIHLIWHSQVEGFVRAVLSGGLPLWDPSPAFGQPLLADPGAQVLYPPTWLNLLMPPWAYYTLFAFGHVLLSGIAFHALARRWGLEAGAALGGSCAWVLAGPFLSLVDLWHHFASAAAGLTRLVRLAEDRPEEVRRVLQIGAVTHVIALHRVAGDLLRPVAEVPSLFPDPVRVEAVPDPLPRAYAVAGVRVADGIHGLMALLDPAFDPRREIVLPDGRRTEAPEGFRGRAGVVREAADRVELEAELSTDGYVVLVDGHDPGWRARVDGRPTALLRANVAFRAVAVPAGRHSVEMVYRPTAALAGLAASGMTLVALAALFAAPLVLRRPGPVAPAPRPGGGAR